MSSIISILPKDEGFSQEQFGAIALCVRDFTLHSKYHRQTTVISGVNSTGFADIVFRPSPKAWWFENRTRAYVRHCIAMIRQENASLAEIHNRPNLLRMIAPKLSCKLALHLHNDPQEMKYAGTADERKALLNLCEGVYCVSAYIKARFLEGLDPGAEQKVYVVHNGIVLPGPIPAKEKLIVYAGRMTQGKGVLLLAQALAIALPQLPDWKAVLIGSDRHSAKHPPSPHETLVRQTVNSLGKSASMCGFLSHEETLAHFARAHIAVIPSVWQEPFGRTAIEAMAYGCAVISSGRGALKEVTADAALTPETLSAESLASALVTLAKNDALREALQRKARLRAQHFAIAKATETLDTVRKKLLS